MFGLDRLFRREPKPVAKRGRFAAAQISRVNPLAAFEASLEPAHRELQRDLLFLRARSRDLAKNNPYMRRYATLVRNNVVGSSGIKFESEILNNRKKPHDAANSAIEDAFEEWSNCVSVCGEYSRTDFEQLVAVTAAIDGEVLIRKVKGFPNKHGFALEFIDPDRLDWRYNVPPDAQGNRVIMGKEVDPWGRALAYHILSAHPWDAEARPVRMRVPASEIVHVYSPERVKGTRGIPWSTSVMIQVNMLGKLWIAELAAANFEANRVGVLRTQQGVNLDDLELDEGALQAAAHAISSEVCSFVGVDPGLAVDFPTLQHPNGAFPAFSAYLLKGISAGLGVAYHSLSGDVSQATYSSARVDLLQERDNWRTLQGWFIRQVCDPIYRAWLEMAQLSLPLPNLPLESLCKPRWWPRSWEWVDPEKDAKASQLAIRAGLSTYQEELGALGRDWRDTFKQRALEMEYQRELGLTLDLEGGKGEQAPSPDATEKPTEEESSNV